MGNIFDALQNGKELIVIDCLFCDGTAIIDHDRPDAHCKSCGAWQFERITGKLKENNNIAVIGTNTHRYQLERSGVLVMVYGFIGAEERVGEEAYLAMELELPTFANHNDRA